MTDKNHFNIIFTANLGADFELLPYLATTIRRARRHKDDAALPTLLLDLGGAYDESAWVCQATENRAPYLMLDAMGYQVARADGLDVGGILGLRPSVQMYLMDDSIIYHWKMREMHVQVGPKGKAPAITWFLADQESESGDIYKQEDGKVALYHPQNYVGKLVVSYPDMEVIHAEKIPFDRSRPDPSIIEMAKFVEHEAQAYMKRQIKGDRDED